MLGETEQVSGRTGAVEAPVRPRPRREERRPGGDIAPAPVARERTEAPSPPEADTRRRSPRRRWLRWGLFLLLPIVLIIGSYWYVTGGQVMTTDDAYVEADTVGVSTDVSGIVAAVEVKENQQVSAGQVLYELDPQPFRIALDRAEAQLGMVHDDIAALQASYRDQQTQLQQAQNDLDYYDTEFKRQQALAAQHIASQQQLDTARRNLDNAQQKVASAKQQLASTAAKLNGDPSGAIEQNPTYRQALAQRDEAARELKNSVVRAPFAGIVTRVSAVTPGKYLAASTPAFYLVDTQDIWVEAQPKETELTYVRPGQPVTVTVDTYPGRVWHGTVQSISPAASQEFSLLPAQNTSGNWVKVVQRVPMRVHVETSDQSLPPLRAGMSAVVEVDTGHARGLPHFLTALFGGAPKASG
jgi:membrane fusion protein, multidrug efflux system